MWWKRWLGLQQRGDTASKETKPVYIVAKCIGCGQCAQGCPLKVKMIVAVEKK